MSEQVLVATYGSLRVGMQNARVNDRAGAKLFGHGKTVENYDLHQFGSAYFPSVSLQHSESKKPVVVDVYATDEAGLTGPYDGLEGCYHGGVHPNNFYNRSLIDVALDDGKVVKAWIYHIDEPQPNRIESGDWMDFNRDR